MMITLTASSDYNTAGKQFVARITGRHAKFTFDRQFIGTRSGKRGDYTSADVDDPGLYETRDTSRKGTDDRYCVIWEDGDQLVKTDVDKETAMGLAKRGIGDWHAEGRRLEIIELQERIESARSKDQEEVLTINYAVGSVGPGAVKRSDLIAAREAEITRLKSGLTSA